MSLPLNTQLLTAQPLDEYLLSEQPPSNSRLIYIALAISLVMHLTIMRALPWLEAVKAKPPITIIAELQQPPPPPPSVEAPTETKPIEPPSRPEAVKVERQPAPGKPIPKTQAVAPPVLAAEHPESVANDYSVSESPQPATAPSEAIATTPAASSTSSTTRSSAKNEVTSPTSTSAWEDGDVWDEYGRNLQRLCERNKRYPAIAIRRSWQGLAKVLVRFSAEGKTLSIAIEKSTGQKVLDEEALEMVKKSLNDLPVPNKFKGKEFRLSIPVDFKLE